MRVTLRLLACYCSIIVPALFGAQSDSGRRLTAKEVRQGFRDSVVLVRIRPGVTAEQVRSTESALGLALERSIGRSGTVRILRFDGERDEEQMAARLKASGLYVFAEPDYIRKPLAVPNDPYFPDQWNLHNTGQGGGASGADISAVDAWSIRNDASGIIVAVLDTGIRTTHEDLAANLWVNEAEVPGNGIDDDANGYVDDRHGMNALIAQGQPGSGDPSDDHGHGTAVASVIAAVGNNGKGISGVAWKTRLMALKFDDREATTDGSSFVSNVLECIDYAVANGARVINMSYGGSYFSHAEFEALEEAGEAGIVFVAAAGNDGAPNHLATNYPSAYVLPNVVAVANTDASDALAASSTYGGMVELAAPGSLVLVCGHGADDQYVLTSGTSFSSPMVAGAMALMAAQFPGESPRQLINRVLRSVDRLPGLSGKVSTSGRLNLHRALASSSSRPFNDDFEGRSMLEGDFVVTRGANHGAGAEAGEPSHGGSGDSLWWSWRAPRAGSVTVDTRGSDFDTLISVYQGSSIAALTLVASDDDGGEGTTSRLTFDAQADVTYHIAVDAKAGAEGMAVLGISLVPANDTFADAEVLAGLAAQTIGNNINASQESGEPLTTVGGESGIGATVWYRWVAPRTADFTVAVDTESFTPAVGIFSGPSVNALTPVAANMLATSFRATSGQTYWIAVDSLAPNAGTFTLSLLQAYGVLPFGSSASSSVAIDRNGSFVCVNDGGFVIYFRLTGETWSKRIPGTVDVATPSFGPDGTIYVTTALGLFALDDLDGATKWSKRFDAGVPGSAGVAADGTVYVHVNDDGLYAYTAAGEQRWRCPIPGFSYSSPSIGSDGTIYLGSDDGHLYAVAPLDGAIRWKFDTGGEVYASASIGSDGTLYIGNIDGDFFAITAEGQQRWTYATDGSITSSAAIGLEGTIYFGSYDHNLYALTSTGDLRWTYATGDEIRASSPLVDGLGNIWIGSYDGYLHAVTPDGNEWQTFPTGGVIRGSPVLDRGSLLWTSADGNVYFAAAGTILAPSAWPMHRQNPARTGRRIPATAPVVLSETVTRDVQAGVPVTLAVLVEGADVLSFQWYRNGTPIAGATGSTLTIANPGPTDEGTYVVQISNSYGSVSTVAAQIRVTGESPSSRIINLSARAVAGSAEKTLIVGFVLGGGAGDKSMLIRGVGPTLVVDPFLVPNPLQDPAVAVFREGVVLGQNDNWEGSETITATSARVGAFPLSGATSRDSALIVDLAPGAYTAHVTAGSGNAAGVALAEFYDAGSSSSTASQARLLNISARADVGVGADVLIVGFVISGTSPRAVLVRAVGPPLEREPFNIPGALADPILKLIDQSGNIVASNNDWSAEGTTAELEAAMDRVGAFPLLAGSTDSVVLVTLQPGTYTAIVEGRNGQRGVALAEVYDAQ